jgi:hypothetical protein
MTKVKQVKLQTHASYVNAISVAFFVIGYIGVGASLVSSAAPPLSNLGAVAFFSISSVVISILGHLFACQLAMRAALENE